VNARPVTIADLCTLTYVSEVQISAEGARVAFVKTNVSLEHDRNESQIAIQDLDRDPLQLLGLGRMPRFSPDGQTLVFSHEREIWVGSPQPRLLGLAPGRIREVAWSPDGKKLALVSDTPVSSSALASTEGIHHITRPRYLADGAGFVHGYRPQVHLLDTRTGALEQLTTEPLGASSVAWSPCGTKLAFVGSLQDPDANWERTLNVIDLDSGVRSTWWEGIAIQCLAWSPTGALISFTGGVGQYRPSMNLNLWVVTETAPAEVLTEDLDRFVGTDRTLGDAYWGFSTVVQGGLWSVKGDSLFFIAASEGRNVLFNVELASRTIKPVEAPNDAVVFDFDIARRDGQIAATVATQRSPTEIWLLPGSGALTHFNGSLMDEVALADAERVTWHAKGGPELEGWLYKPGQQKSTTPPVILSVHGGPYRQHSLAFCHETQSLCALGFAVFCPNPRGSQGYGEEIASAIDNDWGNNDYLDLMAGVDHVLAAHGWNDAQLGVIGGSYGGYMVNWIVTHTDRFQAAVADRSISDLLSHVRCGQSALSFARPLFGSPWTSDGVRRLTKMSPLTYVTQCHTPVLLLHGTADEACRLDQARQFYMGLWENRCEAEMILFPEATHELPRSGAPSLRIRRLEWIHAWFKKHLMRPE
jgi:dipeptidyl aminopeptidase/acylaminoacyl peptidase